MFPPLTMATTGPSTSTAFSRAAATVADLRRAVAEQHPGLAGLLATSAVSVGDEFAGDDRPVPAGVEVALLPPVSGG